MSDFNSQVLDYASSQFKEETTTEPAEIAVTETQAETAIPTEPAEIAQVGDAPIENTETQVTPPDYNSWLKETTGGLFEDVDTFKSSLNKFASYDELEKAKNELEEKAKINPFATDFVAKLNEGIKNGWDTDRQTAFIKINSIDFDSLTPKELKVANMVLNQGYSEDIAKKVVDRQFDLEEYEEGSDERIIKEEELRIASKADRKELEQYKASISKVENLSAEIAEKKELEDLATRTKYLSQVKEASVKLAPNIRGIGEAKFKLGAEGKQEIDMKFDFDKDYLDSMPEKLEKYLVETNAQISNETLAEFHTYARADYLSNEDNLNKLTNSIADTVWSKAQEFFVNKYENRSGIPEDKSNTNVENSQKEYSDFLASVASGKR